MTETDTYNPELMDLPESTDPTPELMSPAIPDGGFFDENPVDATQIEDYGRRNMDVLAAYRANLKRASERKDTPFKTGVPATDHLRQSTDTVQINYFSGESDLNVTDFINPAEGLIEALDKHGYVSTELSERQLTETGQSFVEQATNPAGLASYETELDTTRAIFDALHENEPAPDNIANMSMKPSWHSWREGLAGRQPDEPRTSAQIEIDTALTPSGVAVTEDHPQTRKPVPLSYLEKPVSRKYPGNSDEFIRRAVDNHFEQKGWTGEEYAATLTAVKSLIESPDSQYTLSHLARESNPSEIINEYFKKSLEGERLVDMAAFVLAQTKGENQDQHRAAAEALNQDGIILQKPTDSSLGVPRFIKKMNKITGRTAPTNVTYAKDVEYMQEAIKNGDVRGDWEVQMDTLSVVKRGEKTVRITVTTLFPDSIPHMAIPDAHIVSKDMLDPDNPVTTLTRLEVLDGRTPIADVEYASRQNGDVQVWEDNKVTGTINGSLEIKRPYIGQAALAESKTEFGTDQDIMEAIEAHGRLKQPDPVEKTVKLPNPTGQPINLPPPSELLVSEILNGNYIPEADLPQEPEAKRTLRARIKQMIAKIPRPRLRRRSK